MNDKMITTLLQRLDEPLGRYSTWRAYLEGRQPVAFLSPESRAALGNRLSRLSVNIPRLMIESIAERLRVTGFTGTADDAGLWADWLGSDLDQQSPVLHREALGLGDAYAICWADQAGAPNVSIESPLQVTTLHDPGTRQMTAALKRWTTPNGTDAVVYEPTVITRLHSDAIGATTTGFKISQTIPNPLGVVPVVRFRNGQRLDADWGWSEMADVLSLTDALTKLSIDMLTASEYGARPRRWATGLELEEDEQGNAINPIAETDRMMVNESAEGKFGQLPG